MNRNEAGIILAEIRRTENRLAAIARWSFRRHAMFGLSEGLLVAGLAQPNARAVALIGVAMALLALCITEDRRRHGFFVSGWQPGPTRPLTLALAIFILAMAMVSVTVRDGVSTQPLGYLVGALTFAVCTIASIAWERIYRAGLARGAKR